MEYMKHLNATQPEHHKKSISTTNGIYGHICEFKLFSVTRSSITICGYKTPKNEDILFMTDANGLYSTKNSQYIARTRCSITRLRNND